MCPRHTFESQRDRAYTRITNRCDSSIAAKVLSRGALILTTVPGGVCNLILLDQLNKLTMILNTIGHNDAFGRIDNLLLKVNEVLDRNRVLGLLKINALPHSFRVKCSIQLYVSQHCPCVLIEEALNLHD